MKTVYLIGSFMNDNFGDYLIYQETINAINKEFDNGTIRVISSDVSKFYDDFVSVERMSHTKCMKEADMVVFTGGGYFGEGDNKKLLWNIFFVRYYGLKALHVALSNKPYIIVGVGAGPFKYMFSRWITKIVFNKSLYASVRDQESMDFLHHIGVKKAVEIHADWILGMEKSETIDKCNFSYPYDPDKRYLMVHLISKSNGDGKGIDLVIKEINSYLEENKTVNVIVTCDQTKADLYERTKKLSSMFGDKVAFYYEYKSPYELISIINNSTVVITDKLHVGIVSMNLGKNVVSVPLHNKTPRLYKQLGREKYCIKMNEVHTGDIYKRLDMAFSEPRCVIQKAHEDSQKNRTIMNRYIRRICCE